MTASVQLLPAYTPPRGFMPSILEQYRISDFVEWNKLKALVRDQPRFSKGKRVEACGKNDVNRYNLTATPDT